MNLLDGWKKVIRKIDDTGKDLMWVVIHALHDLDTGQYAERDFELVWRNHEKKLAQYVKNSKKLLVFDVS